MVDFLIHDIPDPVMAALQERAAKYKKTPEEVARRILIAAVRQWVVQKIPKSADMTVIQVSRLRKELDQVFALVEKQPVRIIDENGREFVLMTTEAFHLLGGMDAADDA